MLIQSIHIPVSKNFYMDEFFHGLEFDLPVELINGAQFLRDFFGKPCKITSTYRPSDKFGFHRYGKAVDISFFTNPFYYFDEFKTECLRHNDSAMVNGLLKCGVNGFGIEHTCIHLDIRPDAYCHSVQNGKKLCIFEWIPEPAPFGTSKIIY